MNRLAFIAVLACLLSSCLYTKNAAIRKFCIASPISIDRSGFVKGNVVDSPHTALIEIKDSCDFFKNLYDSLVNTGKFVTDSTEIKSDSSDKNINPRATKWAVLYSDSIVTVKFRITKYGKAQIDVTKHERKIHYEAPVHFKTVVSQPCPPEKELPWWHDYVVALFAILFLVIIVSILAYFIFRS